VPLRFGWFPSAAAAEAAQPIEPQPSARHIAAAFQPFIAQNSETIALCNRM
jgi:hypothetical protein